MCYSFNEMTLVIVRIERQKFYIFMYNFAMIVKLISVFKLKYYFLPLIVAF
jgi:hypothetical protein